MTGTTSKPALHRAVTANRTGRSRRRPQVPADVYRCDDHYVVLCDLPGLDTSTLDVCVQGATISIRAERSAPPLHGATCVTGERPVGLIERHIDLDQPAASTGVTATYTDGVLTLTIPIAASQPRHLHDGRWPAHVLHAVA
ncbi:Hsp20/alpha crystallin family protein [Micromonospora chalcea]|uniref:Hsp20/alpha crystallin family protein n=1 Tax=Micromonospora chalcea TaxID=1874 RepID=UPI00110417AE